MCSRVLFDDDVVNNYCFFMFTFSTRVLVNAKNFILEIGNVYDVT